MEKTISVSRVSLFGEGVGSDSEGNIYFIPRTIPGDTVRVSIVSQDKKYFECELLEVVSPSPARVESPCLYFHQCGGCDWLHWNYSDQLKGKQEVLEHAMERKSLAPDKILPILGAEQPLFYRNRVQLRVADGKIGFFKKKSHELIDIKECKIAQPAINQAIRKLRDSTALKSDLMQKLELYVHESGEVKTVKNAAHAIEGFRQINEEQNGRLQKCVADYVKASRSEKVLELFCGNGNLTFAYQNLVKELIAIDASEAAIEQAKLKRKTLGTDSSDHHTAFICQSVDASINRKLPPEFREHYDTLIIDPPRSGLQGALNRIVHQQLKHIIYISCSLQSFSQDVQCLKKYFRFEEVQPIDMFPQTRHIEFVAKFSRL
ncbi:class I SAM-dependent RNA methyltransferase [bacterium]|nr:class I SAM-dependent RNA methyltransferase [bacterium]